MPLQSTMRVLELPVIERIDDTIDEAVDPYFEETTLAGSAKTTIEAPTGSLWIRKPSKE